MRGWKIGNVDAISVVNPPWVPVYDHPLPPVYANVPCPFCVRLARSDIATAPLYAQSRTYIDSSRATMMETSGPFMKDGVEHYHDGNHATTDCHCEHGHVFELHGSRACPAPGCDYGATHDSIRVKVPRRGYPDETEDLTVWPEDWGQKFGILVKFDPETATFSRGVMRQPRNAPVSSPAYGYTPGEVFIMGPLVLVPLTPRRDIPVPPRDGPETCDYCQNFKADCTCIRSLF